MSHKMVADWSLQTNKLYSWPEFTKNARVKLFQKVYLMSLLEKKSIVSSTRYCQNYVSMTPYSDSDYYAFIEG